MKIISYSGGSFRTSDQVADALLNFVAALGSRHRAETVEVPVVNDDGSLGKVQLVIGPASELVSADSRSVIPDPDERAAVAALRSRTDELATPRPVATSSAEVPRLDLLDEF